jgi:Raf kinase inhibitor-like YbhB/YbcL family protein
VIALAVAMMLAGDFAPNALLPKTNVYAECGGENVSPALRWAGAPKATRSYVLTVFDPDAPGGGFWHWVAYNIPATTHELAAGSGAHPSAGTGEFARNDFGHTRYDGPCPPPGPAHHYVFTLYALDVPRVRIADGGAVEPALKGHVIAHAQVSARYGR